MPKKVLIIYRVDASKVSNQGVIKKLDGQAKGFTQNGWDVDTIRISGKEILLNESPVKTMSRSKFGSVLFEFFQTIGSVIDMKAYDLLYIRYGLSFTSFIGFLRECKSENPALKIILEFPTYPYADEWTGTKGLVVKKVDAYYRKKLHKYIDHAVHLGEEKSILGIPCINSENGIDVNSYRIRRRTDDDKMRLLAVGKWQFWHGLDRLIYGFGESEELQEKMELHIVGDGPALNDLRKLTAYLDLKGVVKFHGPQKGVSLDKLFDVADIGVGTLGMHRKGIKIDSSLKHREYVSRGLPFILCTPDKDFPADLDFIKYFQQSDDPIDLTEVMKLYTSTKDKSPKEINRYAQETLDWSAKILRITEAIES